MGTGGGGLVGRAEGLMDTWAKGRGGGKRAWTNGIRLRADVHHKSNSCRLRKSRARYGSNMGVYV